jgi:hypothetical protein
LLVASVVGASAAAHADGLPAADRPAPTKRHKKRPPKAPKVTTACKTDADCAMTNMADGDCCPSLCLPRVVSKTSADALAKYGATCAKPNGGECAVRDCMPPRVATEPACVSGKCVARAAPSPGRE